MSDVIIRVEKLCKNYILNHQQEKAKTIRDSISKNTRIFRKNLFGLSQKKNTNLDHEVFSALNDVSFEIKQGDRVGIIGRNGAGKSTLLKILSRITEPTSGRISIKGRVASLLEVGTGFHPELTGRENIFLNGAILGMGKVEIRRKFDEIVAFAEVEKFLDTPVKRYSSGMYVRLAFAVAAHLEPEILIVDEVLAVGDLRFQQKCLGKMEDVGKEGRTVLFVSHNVSTVSYLCTRGLLLESGHLSTDSSADEAIKTYLETSYHLAARTPLASRRDRKGTGKIRVSSFRVLDLNGQEEEILQSGQDYILELSYTNFTHESIDNVFASLDFYDEKGNRVLLLRNTFTNSQLTLNPDIGKIYCKINNFPLASSLYRVAIYISHADQETLDWIEDAAALNVDGGDFFGTGNPGEPNLCKVLVKTGWTTHFQGN